MTTSTDIYRAIQARARSDAARTGKPVATGEYLTRHALESFLFRVTQTAHADAFVLKGGILLTAYDVRRPTKDLDSEAVNASVTPAHISQVVHDAAAVSADDGIAFDLDSISIQEIRDDADGRDFRHVDDQVKVVVLDPDRAGARAVRFEPRGAAGDVNAQPSFEESAQARLNHAGGSKYNVR